MLGRRFSGVAVATSHRIGQYRQAGSFPSSATSNALANLLDPDLNEPVLSLKVGSHLIVDPATPILNDRREFAVKARQALPSSQDEIVVPRYPTLERPLANKRKGNLSKVRSVIAVSSGKGGVGKSTVSVNLAASLHLLGARVGIFDADIHGPSLPTMMVNHNGGTWTVKRTDKLVAPVELHGIKCMSYGFVSPGTGGKGQRMEDRVLTTTKGPQASIMRGPIASKTAEELLMQTDWGELDVLVLDLPPGTGDLHLTMCQQLNVDSAVVVTTPQEISFVDVARGIDMLEALKVPVVAIVENMSSFVCDHGVTHFPFGNRGKRNLDRLKTAYGVGWTVSLPIVPLISDAGDQGVPFVLDSSSSNKNCEEAKKVYLDLAKGVCRETLRLVEFGRSKRPSVSYDAESKMIVVRVFDNDQARQFKVPPMEVRVRLNKVDEMMGLKNIPPDTVPVSITPKGNYAVSIAWSDGHSMSIYPYEDLLKVAEDYDEEMKSSSWSA